MARLLQVAREREVIMPQRKRIDKAAPSPLGQYIIAARRRQGWSRKRLAESASIPYTTLRNIETEQQSVKTNESYLQAIAHALDVPFDELRVLAGYMITDSETKEVQDRRLAVLLDTYPQLKKAIATLLERGDKREIDQAATVLEVHRRLELERRRNPND